MKFNRFWLYGSLILLPAILIWLLVFQRTQNQTYQGVEFNEMAPNFQLTDQNGDNIRLSDFLGKLVILTFMDTQCIDTCPITAQYFIQTYQQLNESQKEQIVFLGINVNTEAITVNDVKGMTTAWQLDQIPQWHFLTGNAETLQSVWRDYNISVTARPSQDNSEHTQLIHTPGTYIIDALGQIRWYVSTPYNSPYESNWIPPLNEILITHIQTLLKEMK